MTEREFELSHKSLCLESTPLKMLDCFCGMGGVSDGFALEGFDVTGIDIVDAPKMLGYKHKFIQADMATLKGEDFRGYDVIWGSPPCTDFSTASCPNKTRKGRKAPDPEIGLELIRAFRKFVDDANPKFWLMENVPRTTKFYIVEKPILYFWTSKYAKRALWGNVAFPLMSEFHSSRVLEKDYAKLKWCEQSALKAKIPLACSRAFAKTCKDALLNPIEVGV
ncbi:DNA cytosine methyltransferase [Candidatus Bathyarchaeota archaeon]|nr:DNA cytosine methyltransferase [Candidatus Bathyarchaeota archaeon]